MLILVLLLNDFLSCYGLNGTCPSEFQVTYHYSHGQWTLAIRQGAIIISSCQPIEVIINLVASARPGYCASRLIVINNV